MCAFLPDGIFPARVGAAKSRDHHVPRTYITEELKERLVSGLKEPHSNMERADDIVMRLHCVRRGVSQRKTKHHMTTAVKPENLKAIL